MWKMWVMSKKAKRKKRQKPLTLKQQMAQERDRNRRRRAKGWGRDWIDSRRRFRHLLVVKWYPALNGNWGHCRCDCGNELLLSEAALRGGAVSSCGCGGQSISTENRIRR